MADGFAPKRYGRRYYNLLLIVSTIGRYNCCSCFVHIFSLHLFFLFASHLDIFAKGWADGKRRIRQEAMMSLG